jgi:hypothetical protein
MRQERENSANALADDIDTESGLRLIVDTTPALIYSARPDGAPPRRNWDWKGSYPLVPFTSDQSGPARLLSRQTAQRSDGPPWLRTVWS